MPREVRKSMSSTTAFWRSAATARNHLAGRTYRRRMGGGGRWRIDRRRVNWIIDADVQNFFGAVSQEWLLRFVEHRIGGKRIIGLIQRWLRARVLEGGVVTVMTGERGRAR